MPPVKFNSTPELWSIFHYRLWDTATNGVFELKNWKDYLSVNQSFCDAIVATYRHGDISTCACYLLLIDCSYCDSLLIA